MMIKQIHLFFLTSWDRIQSIKWMKRFCLSLVWNHWPDEKNHFVCLSLTNTELKNFSYLSCTIKNIHAGLKLRDKATSWNSKLGCSKMVPHRGCFACFCEVITSWKIQLMITTFSYSKFFWHYTTILNMYNLLKPVIIHLPHIILESTIKDFLGDEGGFTELRRPFANLWKAHQQVVT